MPSSACAYTAAFTFCSLQISFYATPHLKILIRLNSLTIYRTGLARHRAICRWGRHRNLAGRAGGRAFTISTFLVSSFF